MIVNVSYIIEKTIAIKVDNKYKKIDGFHLPWGQYRELRRELLQEIEDSEVIPEGAEIKEICDKDNKYVLAENGENL